MSSLFTLTLFLLSCFFSYQLAPLLIAVAKQHNLLDYPHDRKAHSHPTPFLGGVVIFISFWSIFGLGIFILTQSSVLFPHLEKISNGFIPKIPGVFFGSFLVFILGLLDDRFDLPPLSKFIFQALAAILLISLGLQVNLFAGFGLLGYLVTFVWILLIINAFNFIDSIDGHCSGIALISCFVFWTISLIVYQPLLAFFVAVLGGALLGFLPYNLKPARMFLGDNGSLFLGYMMAALTLLCSYRTAQYSAVTPFIPILMFGVPIYDTVSVVAARILRGIPPWKGDRNHFAHRLVRLGMGEKVAVAVSYFIALTLGIVAVLSTQIDTFIGKILILLLFISMIAIIALLEYYAAMRIRFIEALAAQKEIRRKRHSA